MPRYRLNDWTEACIRPIRAEDGERLRASHARLSPESRYRRFLATKPDLSIADARYLVEIDGSDHYALVATLENDENDEDGEVIVAVARFVRIANVPDAAEFAIVVNDSYQGQGLATELVSQLAQAATARGIARFRATMLSDNLQVRRLLQRLAAGDMRERRLGSISEVEIDLPGNDEAPLAPAPAMIAGCSGS